MLQYKAILPSTLELLKRIQSDDTFSNFYLAGGTSLALQIGHRLSIDLDFFQYSDEPIYDKIDHLKKFGSINVTNKSNRVLNVFIDDLKVDFINYSYPFIDQIIEIDQIKLVGLKDIAAMKLAAITGRGTKKDFIDLYF